MTSAPPSMGDIDTLNACQCRGPSNSTRPCNQGDRNKAIAGDIDGHIYASVGGFYAKYFQGKTWSSAAEQIVQAAKPQSFNPQVLRSREGFNAWLLGYNSFPHEGAKLSGACMAAQYAWIEGHTTASALSSENPVLIRPKVSNREPGWADVKVIGEFCHSRSGLCRGLLQLCEHARAVFAHQPDRLFLHGFYVCRGMMELWMFDRCGIYSCEAFDIATAPGRFLTVLTGYILMSDDELGLCTLIEEDAVGKYVLCSGDDGNTGSAEKFYLGDSPVFERLNKNIPCEDARAGQEQRRRGRASAFESPRVQNTENLHHGLLIGLPRKLKHIDSDHADISDGLKATVGSGLGAALEFTVPTTELDSSGKEKLVENKTFNILIISPLSRSLHRFDTVPELLGANIIITSNKSKGASHKGILIDLDLAKDLSTGPGSEQYESIGTQFFKAIGVLQAYLPENPHTYRHDLESFFYTFLFLATCRRPVPPGENQLQLPPNCTIGNWTLGRPVNQANRKMSSMLNDVEFALITSEFTPEFKRLTGLAEELRRLLFPLRDGKLWTGTDMTMEGTNALYANILEAFDKVKDYDYSL
ncbi:hypothetical protein EAF04_009611 [Stromatinia cepivora]|nr:hypothetical protein EAF04_009611 [Stromatinia cepivora]